MGLKARPAAVATEFAGFTPVTWDWFRGIEADNSREFFQSRRDDFEQHVKAPITALLERAAAEFGGRVKLFRQNRDIRFSPNKAPYKTNTYGVVLDNPDTRAALYVSISSEGLHAAAGYYEMAKDQLVRYRAAVLDERTGPALAKITAELARDTDVWGATLKTAPRGFDRNHERVELLRHTSLITSCKLAVSDRRLSSADAVEPVFAHWRRAAALCRWLDKNVGESEQPPEMRWRR